jgi:AcrR family transcriptional regulator
MDEIDVVIDGRTARRNRNKDAVLDALIELSRLDEGEPTIEAIAERAGVSYRSVYRYFDDRTDLMLSAIGRVMGDVWPIFDVDGLGVGPLDARITRFVDIRFVAYRQLASLTRIAVRLRADEPAVADGYDQVRRFLREQIEAQFAPELAAFDIDQRPTIVAALDVMFQFESLDYLSHHEQLSDEAVMGILASHVRLHLGVETARV